MTETIPIDLNFNTSIKPTKSNKVPNRQKLKNLARKGANDAIRRYIKSISYKFKGMRFKGEITINSVFDISGIIVATIKDTFEIEIEI